MSNPYQSPKNVPYKRPPAPRLHVRLHKLCWSAWWVGTALIAGSWFGVVSPTVGWIGFGLACAGAFGSYVLTSRARGKRRDYVVLDSRMLQTRGDVYRSTIRRFVNGATLMYDGVAFGVRPYDEIACAVVADFPELDEASAAETADRAKSVFDKLIAECPELVPAVEGRKFRVCIVSGFGADSRELCRMVDGKIEWRR